MCFVESVSSPSFLPAQNWILLRENEAPDELHQASNVFENASAEEHSTEGFAKRKRVGFDWVLQRRWDVGFDERESIHDDGLGDAASA